MLMKTLWWHNLRCSHSSLSSCSTAFPLLHQSACLFACVSLCLCVCHSCRGHYVWQCA